MRLYDASIVAEQSTVSSFSIVNQYDDASFREN